MTVGHRCILHGAEIGDRCLIGMGAILLAGSRIGEGSIIAAGALVPEGMQIPAGSMVMGSPGKVKRLVRPEERKRFQQTAKNYIGYRKEYLDE